jgi:hypothetical protein
MMNKSDYLLALIEEEALEIAHRASKAIRFGLMETQKGQPHTNAHRLEREINDLRAVLEMFHAEQPMFRITPDADQIRMHKNQVLAYMAYSRHCGTLEREK